MNGGPLKAKRLSFTYVTTYPSTVTSRRTKRGLSSYPCPPRSRSDDGHWNYRFTSFVVDEPLDRSGGATWPALANMREVGVHFT